MPSETVHEPTQVSHAFCNLLAFVILMGNAQIAGKSPDYIMEKFTRYTGLALLPGDRNAWQTGLDTQHRAWFNDYLRRWNLEAPTD